MYFNVCFYKVHTHSIAIGLIFFPTWTPSFLINETARIVFQVWSDIRILLTDQFLFIGSKLSLVLWLYLCYFCIDNQGFWLHFKRVPSNFILYPKIDGFFRTISTYFLTNICISADLFFLWSMFVTCMAIVYWCLPS